MKKTDDDNKFIKSFFRMFYDKNKDDYIENIQNGTEMEKIDLLKNTMHDKHAPDKHAPDNEDDDDLGGGGGNEEEYDYNQIIFDYALNGTSSLNIPGLTSEGTLTWSNLLLEYVDTEYLYKIAKDKIEDLDNVINNQIDKIKDTQFVRRILQSKTGRNLAGVSRFSTDAASFTGKTAGSMGVTGGLGLIVF